MILPLIWASLMPSSWEPSRIPEASRISQAVYRLAPDTVTFSTLKKTEIPRTMAITTASTVASRRRKRLRWKGLGWVYTTSSHSRLGLLLRWGRWGLLVCTGGLFLPVFSLVAIGFLLTCFLLSVPA